VKHLLLQCLLLCFAVLIQLVIGVQWLASSPATVITILTPSEILDADVRHSCDTEFEQHVYGLLYVGFLVAVVVALAFKSRGVRENYREARLGINIHAMKFLFHL